MKILNPYRFYRGKSSGNDVPVPALVEPKAQNLLKSISVAETVDVLCEGPIYGLVDQFGRKVYGLDMLKGIYLNSVPVMNSDGKYNFRNIVMEINLGTENQRPLKNFNNVSIYRQANFKLLGPIVRDAARDREGNTDITKSSLDIRKNPNGGLRNFTDWAIGWPTDAKDPFVYVHHINNKDVKKIRVSLIVEQLYDTEDKGTGKGKSGKMGMNKPTELSIVVTCGVEGSKKVWAQEFKLSGTVTSPYACILGETFGQSFEGGGFGGFAGKLVYGQGTIGTRAAGISEDIKRLIMAKEY